MENNITYNFDAFEEASDIMRQCVVNLSEKNARQQIAAMAMQGILTSEGVAELKFWNFNVPYKAYMALTNVKTLQLWKFCNTLCHQSPEIVARNACRYADALIMELNKKEDGE